MAEYPDTSHDYSPALVATLTLNTFAANGHHLKPSALSVLCEPKILAGCYEVKIMIQKGPSITFKIYWKDSLRKSLEETVNAVKNLGILMGYTEFSSENYIIPDFYQDEVNVHVDYTQFSKNKKENEEMKPSNTIVSPDDVAFQNAMDAIENNRKEKITAADTEAAMARAEAQEEKRLNDMRADAKTMALQRRFYFEELVAAGFTDEQAMSILLNEY